MTNPPCPRCGKSTRELHDRDSYRSDACRVEVGPMSMMKGDCIVFTSDVNYEKTEYIHLPKVKAWVKTAQ